MVYSTLSSSPAGYLASSPPARSPSLPIKRLSKSVPCSQQAPQDVEVLQLSRRTSDSSARKVSFGCRTPLNASLCSAPSAARPPLPGPSAVKGHQVVGFSAPAESSSSAPVSPGRRQTKSSLLSRALLDTPISNELYGAAAPSRAFQGLVVLPDKADAAGVDMRPLLQLQEQHPIFHSSNVAAAYAIAARAHAGQTRKSGETVLSHCTATALILAELGLPEEVVAAGLLHDVLCDTAMQPWQLSQVLPASVVGLVTKVSQLNQLSQTYRDNTHSLEAEAMLDMLTGMEDVSALLIKLADRLHNMRTISALSRCKQVRMASETLDVFAVLANRLGAWAIKAELEDLAFKTLNPEEYQLVAEAVAARAAANGSGSGSSPVGLAAGIDELTAALTAAGLQVVDVSGRVKNVYGVWKKVQKNLKRSRVVSDTSDAAAVAANSSLSSSDEEQPSSPTSPAAAAAAAGTSGSGSSEDRAAAIAQAISQVYDIQALRVVVPHKHDCYAAMRVVQELWDAMPGRIKDYIRQRKANGYQSLHLTVRDGRGQPLEVQIRTPKMHYIAEYGFAAHWRYKERLGRQDLWLDRLVQWKKWVASEKLGIVDRKLRPSGSPGGSGGDAALAGLAERLGLEGAAGGGSSAVATAAPIRSISAGDAVAAELMALAEEEQQLFQQQQAADSVPIRGSANSKGPVAALTAAAATGHASSPADEKFAARFRMQPISETEVDEHGASVLISGPRGVRIAQLPARCTVGQLLGSQEMGQLSDQLLLRRSGANGSSGGMLQQLQGLGVGGSGSSLSGCRMAVNGVVVLPGQADEIVLRAGDQLQLLDEPPLLPLLGLGGNDGNNDGSAQQQQPLELPGVMADAGESLQLFVPGSREPMEVALHQKLSVVPRVPVRSSALVS